MGKSIAQWTAVKGYQYEEQVFIIYFSWHSRLGSVHEQYLWLLQSMCIQTRCRATLENGRSKSVISAIHHFVYDDPLSLCPHMTNQASELCFGADQVLESLRSVCWIVSVLVAVANGHSTIGNCDEQSGAFRCESSQHCCPRLSFHSWIPEFRRC